MICRGYLYIRSQDSILPFKEHLSQCYRIFLIYVVLINNYVLCYKLVKNWVDTTGYSSCLLIAGNVRQILHDHSLCEFM